MRADLLGKHSAKMRFGPKRAKWHACRRWWLLLSALKEAQPGISTVSPLQPACPFLDSPEEERTVMVSFRGCVVYFDLCREEKCIALYPENLAEMDVLHLNVSFCSALGTSYGFLLTRGGREMLLDLEAPNLLFFSRDCESALRLQFFSSSEESR